MARETPQTRERQLSLFDVQHHPLLDELQELKIELMTPLEAMQEPARLRDQLKPASR